MTGGGGDGVGAREGERERETERCRDSNHGRPYLASKDLVCDSRAVPLRAIVALA